MKHKFHLFSLLFLFSSHLKRRVPLSEKERKGGRERKQQDEKDRGKAITINGKNRKGIIKNSFFQFQLSDSCLPPLASSWRERMRGREGENEKERVSPVFSVINCRLIPRTIEQLMRIRFRGKYSPRERMSETKGLMNEIFKKQMERERGRKKQRRKKEKEREERK